MWHPHHHKNTSVHIETVGVVGQSSRHHNSVSLFIIIIIIMPEKNNRQSKSGRLILARKFFFGRGLWTRQRLFCQCHGHDSKGTQMLLQVKMSQGNEWRKTKKMTMTTKQKTYSWRIRLAWRLPNCWMLCGEDCMGPSGWENDAEAGAVTTETCYKRVCMSDGVQYIHYIPVLFV